MNSFGKITHNYNNFRLANKKFFNYFHLPIAHANYFTYLCTINLKQQIYENNKTFIY